MGEGAIKAARRDALTRRHTLGCCQDLGGEGRREKLAKALRYEGKRRGAGKGEDEVCGQWSEGGT